MARREWGSKKLDFGWYNMWLDPKVLTSLKPVTGEHMAVGTAWVD